MSIATTYEDIQPNKIEVIPHIPIIEPTVEMCNKELTRRIDKYIGRFCGKCGKNKGDLIPIIAIVMEEKEGKSVLINYMVKTIMRSTALKSS
jgi:hypothetical protein